VNDYGYNLDGLMIVYTDYYYCLLLSLIFINDTLSDIKGEFDVVIC